MIDKIKTYFSYKDGVVAVYLFGSYAQGRQRDRSDVDIGILFETADLNSYKKKRNLYMVELARLLRKDIHPVILNLAGEELLKQIFLTGNKVFVRDEKKLSHYQMIMTSRIADFCYYKNLMQKGFLNKLMKGQDIG